MDPICFSGAGVAVIGGLLSAMSLGLGYVFRALLKAQLDIIQSQALTIKTQNEQNLDMLNRLDRSMNISETQGQTNQDLIRKTGTRRS